MCISKSIGGLDGCTCAMQEDNVLAFLSSSFIFLEIKCNMIRNIIYICKFILFEIENRAGYFKFYYKVNIKVGDAL